MRSFNCLLIGGLFLASAALQAMAQSVQLPYKQVDVKNVSGTAVFSGASAIGNPGQPALPSYIVSFLLPPNVDFSGISVSLNNPIYKDLSAQYEVSPMPPFRRDDGTFEWLKGATIIDGKDMAMFGKNDFFPNDFKGTVSMGPLREYNLVHIRINPYLYNPVTKTLRKLTGGTLKVSVSAYSSSKPRFAREDWVEKMFIETVANPEAINAYGEVPNAKTNSVASAGPALAASTPAAPPSAASMAGCGYLIFVATYIQNQSTILNTYIQHLQSLGATVTTYNDVQINPGSGNNSAKDKSNNIRFWIKNWYDVCINQGISPKYVLLIGNPDTNDMYSNNTLPIIGHLPMYVWQWPNNGPRTPTDWYYTNLNLNWDQDMSASVALGRIPVYVIQDPDNPDDRSKDILNDVTNGNLDKYLQKAITYTDASGDAVEWRRNILGAAEPFGFGENPYDDNFIRVGNSVSPLLAIGWTATRCYNPYVQYAGAPYFLIPPVVNMSPLPEYVYPTGTRFVKSWMSETPSIVVWATHGGADGACGLISTDPNLKGDFYTMPLLNSDAYPAMVVAGSCHTADPCVSNNLGTRILYANAINYIGATISPGGGDDPWQNFPKQVAVNGLCAADAWNKVRYDDHDPPIGITYNLYGCPEAALNLPSVCLTPVLQNLKATTKSKSQIQLTWDANPSAVVYIIQRSTDFSLKRTGFSTIQTIPSTSNTTMTYTDGDVTPLTPKTKYKYRVAFQAYGFPSGYSKIDSACTFNNLGAKLTPNIPNGLYAVAASNCAQITWFNMTGVTFNIKRSINANGPFITIINKEENSTSFLDSNLMNNTTYYYVVSAVNQYGQSDNSTPVSVMPASTINAPQLQNVQSAGNPWDIKYDIAAATPYTELGFLCKGALKFPDGSYGLLKSLNNPRRRSASDSYSALANNTDYYLWLAAANDINTVYSNSPYYYKTPVNTNNQENRVPQGLSATTLNPTQIFLMWGFSGTGKCSYTQVFYKPMNGVWQSTNVTYPGFSALLTVPPNTSTKIYLRTVLNPLSNEPGDAISCSDFTTSEVIVTTAAPQLSMYEAENAVLSGGAKTNTNHTGYSGTGFVDGFVNNTTAKATFNVTVASSGTYEIRLHYSAGSGTSTNTGLYVNSTTKLKNITCPGTGNWNAWADETETVTLNAGSNTIVYKAETSSGSCINLDYVSITNLIMNRIEAENATLEDGAKTNTNHNGYSGTGFVDGYLNNTSAKTTFKVIAPLTGSYAIRLHYSAGNGTSTNIGLFVNNNKIKNITCPGTGNWDTWTDVVEIVTLEAGNNAITYKAESSSNICINLDYMSYVNTGLFKYEAENSALTGGAWTNTNHWGFSGAGFVDGFFNNTSAQASLNVYAPAAGTYEVKLHYSAGLGTSSNTGIYVNGSKIKNITCPGTKDWDTWTDEVETVKLNAGNNTIAYKAETASQSPINLDYILLTYMGIFRREAENATLSGGAKTNTNHNGYSGASFVDGFASNTTAKAAFTINVASTGSYIIKLHYSAGNGTSTNTGFYLNNGSKIKNITCPSTGNWDTWADEQESVTLNAGSNTIAYKSESSTTTCINIDYITVSP